MSGWKIQRERGVFVGSSDWFRKFLSKCKLKCKWEIGIRFN